MPDYIVIVDYGGVLGDHHQEPAESQLAAALGVSIEQSRELVSEQSAHGQAFREDRITETEFWDRVADLIGMSLLERPSNSLLSRLWAETYKLNHQVLSIIRETRIQSPVGVLTNIDRVRSSYLVDVIGLLRFVDIYLPSYKFKSIKPQRALWIAADTEIRLRFGAVEVFYFDDRPRHVEASQIVGWRGFLYQSPFQLLQELKTLGLLFIG